jgi:hypothetical protein
MDNVKIDGAILENLTHEKAGFPIELIEIRFVAVGAWFSLFFLRAMVRCVKGNQSFPIVPDKTYIFFVVSATEILDLTMKVFFTFFCQMFVHHLLPPVMRKRCPGSGRFATM